MPDVIPITRAEWSRVEERSRTLAAENSQLRSRLEQAGAALEREAAVRRRVEADLRQANETLEARVAERTRELHAAGNCNQVLMRAEDESTLLNEICRIVCDEAGYRMAWVGYPENDATKTVRVIARAGTDEGYLEKANILWSDTEHGRGPTGTAIRSGITTCIQDFATAPQAVPWREQALLRGYRSNISLPLKDENGAVFGAFTVYSTELNAFTPDEVRLLEELAGDLAFGIGVLRIRQARRHNDAINASRLHLIQFSANHTLDELLEETLNETERLTGSLIGFYHFVEDDQVSLTLQNWSTRTKAEFCKAEGKGQHYAISKAGVWVECVSQRRPVIHNDYASLPNRRGMPEGHATVLRELVVPVLRGPKIKAILGVGNKPEDYEEQDVETVSLLADLAWEIAERKRAEEALRAGEEKYRTLVHELQVAVIVHAADTRIVTCNSTAQTLLGLTEDQLMGKTAMDPAWHFFHEDGSVMPLAEYPVKQVLDTQQPLRNRVFGVHRPGGGPDVWVLVNANPVLGRDQQISQVIVTFTDVTDWKQAQEKIAHLAAIVESSDDAIIGKTPDETIVSWNRGAERIYGYTAAEIVGKPVSILVPSGLENELAGIMAMLSRGEIVEHLETTRRRKDGQVIHVALTISPIKDARGQIVGASTIARDITARKLAEEHIRRLNSELEQRVRDRTRELAVSEERMRLFFERQLMGTAITSPEKGWLQVNDKLCQMLGYSREELRHLTWAELTFPEDLAADVAQFDRLLKGEIEAYTLEKRFVRKDGTLVYTNLAVGCVRRPDRSVDYVLALMEDITDRKRAEQNIQELNEELRKRATMLETTNRELESFSHSVSHDLRAPLRSIDGFSRVLLEDYADKLDAEGKDVLHTIRASSQRMAHLIDDILRLSRLNRGELRWDNVDLSGIVAEVAAELRQTEPERKAEFIIAPGCIARGDVSLLRIALENILRNAWKYTGKKPSATIEFGTTETADGPVYFVRDNGCGFDMQYVQRLFGAFQRLHTATEYPGTGLGLASVQRIINRHGGRVWIEGEVDHGATLSFTLPRN